MLLLDVDGIASAFAWDFNVFLFEVFVVISTFRSIGDVFVSTNTTPSSEAIARTKLEIVTPRRFNFGFAAIAGASAFELGLAIGGRFGFLFSNRALPTVAIIFGLRNSVTSIDGTLPSELIFSTVHTSSVAVLFKF